MKIRASKNQQIFCLIIIAFFLLVNLLRTNQQLHRYVDNDIGHSLNEIKNYLMDAQLEILPMRKNIQKKEILTSYELEQLRTNYSIISREIVYLYFRCGNVKEKIPKKYEIIEDCSILIDYSEQAENIDSFYDILYKRMDKNNSILLSSTDVENFNDINEFYKKLGIKLQELD